jgi:DNA-3-methyladenine glycosylase
MNNRLGAEAPLCLRCLRREELPVATEALAIYLIGKVLVHEVAEGRFSGRIVETEAYPPGDASGHAFRGPTPGTRSLYLAPGHAYVYFIYGRYYLLNVSSEPAGVGAGVLLRALEPLEGIAEMERRRGVRRRLDLARGPGRLTQALVIDKRYDGLDLCGAGPLWLAAAAMPVGRIGVARRLGISREIEQPRRFYELGSPFVSGAKRLRE